MFDWNDLKHFLAFARTGSMQAAAKTLGVSQSTVSRRLAELEQRLGHRLVERDLGGYRLTEHGEQLRPDAERIEAAVASFERHLASCQKEITGTLRLTCPTTIAHRLARTSLIDAFHARHPGLRVELVMSDHYLDLAKGEADLAIRSGQSPDEWRSRPLALGEIEIMVAHYKLYPEARMPSVEGIDQRRPSQAVGNSGRACEAERAVILFLARSQMALERRYGRFDTLCIGLFFAVLGQSVAAEIAFDQAIARDAARAPRDEGEQGQLTNAKRLRRRLCMLLCGRTLENA